ncbi:MAG: 2-amino-4-hydroxy-6-hydroxymethyldihydropteridine diphosphokinase [Hyphomicrobiales bacterium]
MIIIGLGSNLAGPWGTPRKTTVRALDTLRLKSIKIVVVSSLYTSKAYGRNGGADYVNAVAQVDTPLPPEALIKRLQYVERLAERARGQRWGARTLDIDLLDWHGRICGPRLETGPTGGSEFRALSLPHPGILTRPFVALPLAEIAPDWHHPVTGETATVLAQRLKRGREGKILARESFAQLCT